MTIFNTKVWKNHAYNGQPVTILKQRATKDGYRYDVKFADGKVIRNCYDNELKEVM